MTIAAERTINIGIAEDQRRDVATILHRILSDEFVLYTKTRNYHWNVVGWQFHSLHEMFEDQYEELAEAIDEVAERVRMIGALAIGTLTEFMAVTTLSEHPGQYPDATTMVANLTGDHEQIIRNLRGDVQACEQLNDAGTSDFLTELLEKHEKIAWMLRALLSDRAMPLSA